MPSQVMVLRYGVGLVVLLSACGPTGARQVTGKQASRSNDAGPKMDVGATAPAPPAPEVDALVTPGPADAEGTPSPDVAPVADLAPPPPQPDVAPALPPPAVDTAPPRPPDTSMTPLPEPPRDAAPPPPPPDTAPPPTTDLGTGLVAYWRVDEGQGSATARDSSGNGNTATLMNGNNVWGTGRFGGGLNFTTHYLEAPSSTTFNGITGAVTLAAWVNRRASNDAYATIVRRSTSANADIPLWSLDFFENKVGMRLGSQQARAAAVSPNATWIHVAATYDGTTIRVFQNGTQVAMQGHTGQLGSQTSAVSVGAALVMGNEDNLFLDATVDEVLVYNRALSAADVMRLASGTQPPAR